MTKDFVASIHDFIAGEGIPLVHFASGQRKDDVAQEYLANHSGEEGVLFVGRAQEKTPVFRHREAPQPADGSGLPVAGAARRLAEPPDRVGLVFDRKVHTKGRHPTPGRFRTRVITNA